MRFELYTEKTVAQAASALNARISASGGRKFAGSIGKEGEFRFGTATQIFFFTRWTFLTGKLQRQSGVTVITGHIPSGVDSRGQIIIFVALGAVALALAVNGNLTLALVMLPVIALLYLPLTADRRNSETLLAELRRTLKAGNKPPKPAARGAAKAGAKSASKVGTRTVKPAAAPKPGSGQARTAAPRSGSTRSTSSTPSASRAPSRRANP